MTNEKAIMNLESWQIDLPTNSLQFEVVEKAIKALKIESCKKETGYGWIPVSERLPEEPYGCLVTVEDEEPMTGQFFDNILPYFVGWDGERWNDSDGEQCPFEVIAWMPLPKPYQESKKARNNMDGIEKLGINIGDEVVSDYGAKGVVVGIDTCEGKVLLSLLMRNYKVPQLVKASRYKTKTGRHFPQIIEVLEQIKGEADEK